MKLEVGMYVRTKEGIRKIKEVWDGMYGLNRDLHNRYPEGHPLFEEDIEEVVLNKPSFDLINLIEKGDYVNGVEVEEINDKEIMLVDTHLWIDKKVANKLIESVVTKEQMEAIEYVT